MIIVGRYLHQIDADDGSALGKGGKRARIGTVHLAIR